MKRIIGIGNLQHGQIMRGNIGLKLPLSIGKIPLFATTTDLTMQPVLFYYVNLFLCGLVFIELLATIKKNPILKLYLILIIASLFVMNIYAITGIDSRIQFILAKSTRLVYVCSLLLALIYIVQSKIPRWFYWLIGFSAAIITGIRLAYFDEINIKALPNIPNHVFSVGAEFYSPKPGARILVLALGTVAIIIGYYYYRRLLMKLDMDSAHYKQISRWVISLVVPFFLLAIFCILGNLRVFDEAISSYLFAFFSCTIIFSFVLRPRFLDTGLFRECRIESASIGYPS